MRSGGDEVKAVRMVELREFLYGISTIVLLSCIYWWLAAFDLTLYSARCCRILTQSSMLSHRRSFSRETCTHAHKGYL